MKLTDFIELKGICVGLSVKEKDEVLDLLVLLQQKCGNTDEPQVLRQDIYYAEEQETSAIGAQVALPYVRSEAVKRPMITAVTIPGGVDFDAPDGEKTRLVFFVALPKEEKTEDPYPALTVLLMNEELREALIAEPDEAGFIQRMQAGDRQADPMNRSEQELPLIIALLGCKGDQAAALQGQLERAAQQKELRVQVLWEQEDPAHFPLPEAVRQADGILLLGDVPKHPSFAGKRVLQASCEEGLHQPEHLLTACLSAAVWQPPAAKREGGASHLFFEGNEPTPLLNTLAMAGAAFLLLQLIFSLTGALDSIKLYFMFLSNAAFFLLGPVLAATIACRLTGREGLAVGLVSGILAEQVCGGIWAALACGFLAGGVMRLFQKQGTRLHNMRRILGYGALLAGFLLSGVLVMALRFWSKWAEAKVFNLIEVVQQSNRWLGGLLLSGFSALDPGGPLSRGAQTAANQLGNTGGTDLKGAVLAGLFATALGVLLYLLVDRKNLSARGREACGVGFLSLFCGNGTGLFPFAAASPVKVLGALSLGGAAAGAMVVSFGCEATLDRQNFLVGVAVTQLPFFWISVVLGAFLAALLLFWTARMPQKIEKNGKTTSAHKV